jgi:protein LSM12
LGISSKCKLPLERYGYEFFYQQLSKKNSLNNQSIPTLLPTNQTLQELSGEVFAYDNGSKTLVLREQGSTPFHHNVRILNCEYIASVTEDTPPATPFSDELPEVDTERCSARYAKALRTAEVDAAKIGVGVTKEAQEIFDGLNKTLPCRWEGKTIIVMEEVCCRCVSREKRSSTLSYIYKLG